MKMIPGSGTISNYQQYSHNYTDGDYPYKIPVPSLSEVQLYIDIGPSAPGSASYELIDTSTQAVEGIAPINYVIGQDENDRYYGVFAGFAGSSARTFVIAITLGSQIYFSEEYAIDCNTLTLIQGCYGNLEAKLSHDCNGQYFGISEGGTMGDAALVYKHQLYLRRVDVTKSAIKNTFKQGKRRTFSTIKEKIFLFEAEFIPEWYLDEIDAVFTRGEVYIGSTQYLVDSTPYERSDTCPGTYWKPNVLLKENCEVVFSCEENPCLPPESPGSGAPPEEVCCDPTNVTAEVEVSIET